MSFAHGFPGFPLLVHLAANGVLFWFCGPFCEKILGTTRFAILVGTAIIGFSLTHMLFWVDGHGASGVIWALAPVVFVTLRVYRKTAPEMKNDPTAQQSKIILFIMWIIVTFFMTLIPYFQGWQGNPLWAIVLGNTFHITATIIGFVFALSWRKHIENRLIKILNREQVFKITASDRTVIWLSLLGPLFIIIILTLVITGYFSYF
jgi:membrane associated rhomboid family serine protease